MDKYLIKAIVMTIAVLLTVSIASANGMQGEPQGSNPSGGQPHNPNPDGGRGGIGGDCPYNHNPSPDGGKGGIGGDVSF